MKNLMALTLMFMSTSLYAVNIDAGNNLGQEPAPERVRERIRENPNMTERNRRVYDSSTYGREDSISTGQSATRRDKMDTPANTRPVERCIDRSGYSYSKNDSGYAACVNQSLREMRNRSR